MFCGSGIPQILVFIYDLGGYMPENLNWGTDEHQGACPVQFSNSGAIYMGV